jgi:hypothetical protein
VSTIAVGSHEGVPRERAWTLKEVVSLNTGGPVSGARGRRTVIIELGTAGIARSIGQTVNCWA